MPTAIAAHRGQTEGSGEDSRTSGSASVSVLTRISRLSARMPAIAGSASRFSHRGAGPVTAGIRVKFCGGGGDDVAHSRVSASHGLGPADTPRIPLRIMFQNSRRKLDANVMAPMVERRFSPPHG